MAQRVVKLKPEKGTPPAPAVRVSRADDGIGFLVGIVDKAGHEDFRSQSEHRDYDAALKEAEQRAHGMRLPLRNETGVAVETKSEPAKRETKSAEQASTGAGQYRPPSADLPPLAEQFKLPSIDDRLAKIDPALVAERSAAIFREDRERYLATHAQLFGDSRDFGCTYTQKTHDQIQGQLSSLLDHSLVVQSILYAFLERAFARIEELERNSLTVDSFEAQVAADDRTIELAFGNGEHRKVASFKWPVPVYRGTYKPGQQYDAGDMVTADGSGWIAKRATSSKPGTPNSGFQLAIKRGRDGRDASA